MRAFIFAMIILVAVMTFVFGVGAFTIVVCVGLAVRWLFTYIL